MNACRTKRCFTHRRTPTTRAHDSRVRQLATQGYEHENRYRIMASFSLTVGSVCRTQVCTYARTPAAPVLYQRNCNRCSSTCRKQDGYDGGGWRNESETKDEQHGGTHVTCTLPPHAHVLEPAPAQHRLIDIGQMRKLPG